MFAASTPVSEKIPAYASTSAQDDVIPTLRRIDRHTLSIQRVLSFKSNGKNRVIMVTPVKKKETIIYAPEGRRKGSDSRGRKHRISARI